MIWVLIETLLVTTCAVSQVGMDAEWQPEKKGKRNPVSLLQLATREVAVVVDLQTMCRAGMMAGDPLTHEEDVVDQLLGALLADPSVHSHPTCCVQSWQTPLYTHIPPVGCTPGRPLGTLKSQLLYALLADPSVHSHPTCWVHS